jgi:hypothetical protein
MARVIKQFAAVSTLLFVAWISPVLAQTSSMKPGITRQVTSGCTNTAVSKDFLGTIIWRSANTCAKTQTLPACGNSNNGAWIQVSDGQKTATTYPITVATVSGSTVSGPETPVQVKLDGGGLVLTCDGTAHDWFVTATALPMIAGTGGGTTACVAILADTGIAILVDTGIALATQCDGGGGGAGGVAMLVDTNNAILIGGTTAVLIQ